MQARLVAPRRPISLPLSVSASFVLFLFVCLFDAECPFSPCPCLRARCLQRAHRLVTDQERMIYDTGGALFHSFLTQSGGYYKPKDEKYVVRGFSRAHTCLPARQASHSS